MIRTLPCALCLIVLASGRAAAADEPLMLPPPTPSGNARASGSAWHSIQNLLRVRADEAAQEQLAEPKGMSKTEAPQVLATHVAAEPALDPCFFIRADYLMWRVRRGPAPALLTTGPADGTSSGVLDEPSTSILFDTQNLDYGTFSGARVGAGWNFGPEAFWGLELSAFALQQRDVNFTAASNGTPLLVRPFLSVLDTQESGVEVASPNSLRGEISIKSETEFWGAEANLVAHSVRDTCRRFDLFGGFRALRLDENLSIQENLVPLIDGAVSFQRNPVGNPASILDPPPAAGSRITVLDQFSTENRFYGGQVGGRFQWLYNRFTVDLTGKLALGVTHQESSIAGVSTLDNPATVTQGGLLALKSNIGELSRDQFTVVPELGINFQYDVTPRIRTRIGYSGLYWSAVARPGNQIDRNINPKQIPTGQDFTDPINGATEQIRPAPGLRDNGFWAHGLNVGIEFRY